MEKGLEWQFDSYLQEIFQLKEVDVQEYSPLTLAYIGDGIYDLVIRTLVINRGNKQVQKLHQETSALVQASAPGDQQRQQTGAETSPGDQRPGAGVRAVADDACSSG